MNEILGTYKKELVGIVLITLGFVGFISFTLNESTTGALFCGISMGVGLSLLTLNLLDFIKPPKYIPDDAYYLIMERNSTHELWVRNGGDHFKRMYSHPNRQTVETHMLSLIHACEFLTTFDSGPITHYEMFNEHGIHLGTQTPKE